MKAEEIKIRVSPMTNTIYAGRISSNGTKWTQKHDVTEQVLSAIAQYMDGHYNSIEFAAGTLQWESKRDKGGV